MGRLVSYIKDHIPLVSRYRRTIKTLKRRLQDHDDNYTKLMNALLNQRSLFLNAGCYRVPVVRDPVPLPKIGDQLDSSLQAIHNLAPKTLEQWAKCQQAGEIEYEKCPVHNCSISGRECVNRYKGFIVPYLSGRVLDIGCGPLPVPDYLTGYPTELIAGIDPIAAPHPFAFCRGIAEFLPWEDQVFDTVLVATSLDHVILLDKVLEEVRRVLIPGGLFLVWASFLRGSKKYDPYAFDVKAIDKYHLFHLDRSWFEELVGNYFSNIEVIEVYHDLHYSDCFYALKPN